jgi:hypothetical protein
MPMPALVSSMLMPSYAICTLSEDLLFLYFVKPDLKRAHEAMKNGVPNVAIA